VLRRMRLSRSGMRGMRGIFIEFDSILRVNNGENWDNTIMFTVV
jgi:hypothetical protein